MIRVLIVDDDFMVARVHSGFVARVPGFEVVGTAQTGADALKAVASMSPDLVLLDIFLPDMTGLEVLAQLRQEQPDVDVLIVSAARDVETVKRAARGGVIHYLVKPFDQAALREQLEHYAARRRRLTAIDEAEQEDLDRLFMAGSRRARAVMPKGLSSETDELVRQALRRAGAAGLSASECAEVTGLSRVSARRYLEHIVDQGRADVRQRYGAAGRPERRFRWVG
jgi:response regulator of citrate/malate metabolism